MDESVGTFRWNDSLKLINAPEWKEEFVELLPGLNSGWHGYVGERFQYTAKPGTTQITVEPHQIDGLSFSMTLVRLIALLRLHKHKALNLVVMGSSAKVEERIFCRTNYFEELTNFYPEMVLDLYFIGPELSTENHGKKVQKNPRMSASFFRGKTTEFLDSFGITDTQVFESLKKDRTLFLGFNPGFGSGYEALLLSWACDLIKLLDLRYSVFFTQANDFSDLRGEQHVFKVLFEEKVKMILPPEENPFRAMTHYQGEGAGSNVWCCANTHLYGFQGWLDPVGGKLTSAQIRQNLKSETGQKLVMECRLWAELGGVKKQ